MAMEFYIACAPEDHPVVTGSGGFRRLAGLDEARGKVAAFGSFISF